MIKKVFRGIRYIVVLIFAYPLGKIMYSPEFFPKGRFFSSWKSEGWRWVISDFWGRLLFGSNKGIKWPVSPFANIGAKIEFDPDDLNNFQMPGNYFQTWNGTIHIGKGSLISQNTGIITSNHDLYDLNKRAKMADVYLGKQCWIGMNCIILPGVILGDHTVVAAGSIVTKPFPDGYAVLAGNPAKIVKSLKNDGFID